MDDIGGIDPNKRNGYGCVMLCIHTIYGVHYKAKDTIIKEPSQDLNLI